MDKEIEKWVATYLPCQESRLAPPIAPIHEWEVPKAPWSRIHIDLEGPVQGQTFVIMVDAYSNWLKVAIMTNTTAEVVIKVLRKLFSTHGQPDIVVSDNRPQFMANQFDIFLAGQGIRHTLSVPGHLATNGQVGRMV